MTPMGILTQNHTGVLGTGVGVEMQTGSASVVVEHGGSACAADLVRYCRRSIVLGQSLLRVIGRNNPHHPTSNKLAHENGQAAPVLHGDSQPIENPRKSLRIFGDSATKNLFGFNLRHFVLGHVVGLLSGLIIYHKYGYKSSTAVWKIDTGLQIKLLSASGHSESNPTPTP